MDGRKRKSIMVNGRKRRGCIEGGEGWCMAEHVGGWDKEERGMLVDRRKRRVQQILVVVVVDDIC